MASSRPLSALILHVSRDPSLLLTRRLLFRFAGYTVASANSIESASCLFRASNFDLVILCQSLDTDESRKLMQVIREHGCTIPVISVDPLSATSSPMKLPDSTAASDPAPLLSHVHEVLRQDRAKLRIMGE